jgi:uncharacterized membrane protein (DUF373 family)
MTTGITTSAGEERRDPAEQDRPSHWPGVAVVGRWTSALERSQDAITVMVGVLLIALAGVLLISGIVDFATSSSKGISSPATSLLDRVLLVLIVVEIVHTVVLSLRAHRLIAQPFIVVGLIAVIRRILLVLTPGTHITASTSELALLVSMVAVFIAGLIAVNHFEQREE